jgi:hypothetical protein
MKMKTKMLLLGKGVLSGLSNKFFEIEFWEAYTL